MIPRPPALAFAPVLIFALTLRPAAADTTAALAGRYDHPFRNALVDGHEFQSDDVVEIVPIAPHAAYIRVSLQFYNGHSCNLAGVAKSVGPRLVYRQTAWPDANGSPCVLTIARAGRDLVIDDADGSCKINCGVRGSLSQATIPFASRRPIAYLRRLEASPDYADALREWRSGK